MGSYKEFSKFVVIFIDVLGSKNRLKFDEQYRVNNIFHDEFDKHGESLSHVIYRRRIYSFSDCAYIFYDYKQGIEDNCKDLGKLLTVALCNCERIFLKLLSERIVFRGGITYGDAYVDENRALFFGNAVNRTYTMESTEAIHPRILVDNFVAKKVIENIETVKYKSLANDSEFLPYIMAGLMPQMPLTGDGIIEKDLDGRYIYNYLHFPENNFWVDGLYTSGQEFIKAIIKYCDVQVHDSTEYKIIDKYLYLKRFCESKII